MLATVILPFLAIGLLGGRYREWNASQQGLLFFGMTLLPLFVYFVIKILIFQKTEHSIKARQSIRYMDAALRAWAGRDDLAVIPIVCQNCDNDSFRMVGSDDDTVYEIECIACGTKKNLMVGEESQEECATFEITCPFCDAEVFNMRIAPVRLENGNINKRVPFCYRCTACRQVFISAMDVPFLTADIERNI